MSARRLPAGGGEIDRTRPLGFTFDGRPVDGFHGDTIASALLAAGVANPQLDVSIVTELPREHSHSAKFKLIESRSVTGAAAPTPTS